MVACSWATFARSLLTRASGGKHREFSWLKGKRSPSTAMHLGSGFQLTYPNLSVEAGGDEIHRVRTPFSIGLLAHGRIELEI